MSHNRLKGEAVLSLKDGRSFTLVLDMEALLAAEEVYGHPLARVLADVDKGFLGAKRALFAGALRAHHPTVTAKDALDLIGQDAEAVTLALNAAILAGMGQPAEGKQPANPPKARARGTSKSSGAGGAKRG